VSVVSVQEAPPRKASYLACEDLLNPMPSGSDLKVIHVATPRKSYKTDVVVISDIHLGSEVSRTRDLRRALAQFYPFRRLIILGDLFENLDFSSLTRSHYRLIEDIRRFAAPRSGITVDWIEGNHDETARDIIPWMLGVNAHRELFLDLYGKSYLFIHGHQFDDFLNNHPVISTLASNVYEAVQRREGHAKNLSRWLKRSSKEWLKVCAKIEHRAVKYAAGRRVDYVLCGHTHYFDADTRVEGGGIQYLNTGCWTDSPATLTTIGPEGARRHLFH